MWNYSADALVQNKIQTFLHSTISFWATTKAKLWPASEEWGVSSEWWYKIVNKTSFSSIVNQRNHRRSLSVQSELCMQPIRLTGQVVCGISCGLGLQWYTGFKVHCDIIVDSYDTVYICLSTILGKKNATGGIISPLISLFSKGRLFYTSINEMASTFNYSKKHFGQPEITLLFLFL